MANFKYVYKKNKIIPRNFWFSVITCVPPQKKIFLLNRNKSSILLDPTLQMAYHIVGGHMYVQAVIKDLNPTFAPL